MIFPEGTRSEDGQLLEFRDGPFKLAKDCDVPLVPIVIDGTSPILPKGSMLLNFNGRIQVKVLPAVYAKDFESVKKMRDHVRELMASELNKMRGIGTNLNSTAELTAAN